MPYGHQIWWEEPQTKAYCIAGVKGHAGVSWGQEGVNMLSNALWPPNLVGRTPDQSVIHWWGQRSCRGHPGSTRGQIAYKCRMTTKFGGKNHWPKRNALLGSKVMKGSAGVKLFNNALWPPNLVGRTHDQSVMYCWGQRSCTGQPRSTRGQIP